MEIPNEILERFKKIEARLDLLEVNGKTSTAHEQKELDIDIVFNVDGSQLTVLQITGNKTDEKIRNIALLALLGYKQKLGQDKVLASEIKRNVATHHIPVENFGTYLQQIIPQSILRVGKVGNNKVSYKLTPFGEAKAKKLLEEIIK